MLVLNDSQAWFTLEREGKVKDEIHQVLISSEKISSLKY